MLSKEIRQKFLDFYQRKDHTVIPSASLFPENDPTTLFTNSGMQPIVPYLMGEEHPSGKRLVDSQKCFRSEDIEEIGNNRHLTFFEMLGNWSLGDYFKKEQLFWFFEFLTKELGLDPKYLYVTVFRGNPKIGVERDKESVKIWKKIFSSVGIKAEDVDMAEKSGLQGGRIFYYDETKNWWSRSGLPQDMPVGEIGGPDSEVFYDLGADRKIHENSAFKNQLCHVNCDCGRFVEIGNSVFIEFIKAKEGFEPLIQKNVDFGGGLERITMVVQGKQSFYETDLFKNSLKKIEQLSGKKYSQDEKNKRVMRIIAEHIRAVTFLMGDNKGIEPSNLDQGYVARRLIRRAIRYGRQLDMPQSWTQQVAGEVIRDYSDSYHELERNKDFILGNLEVEEEKFSKTLEKGLKKFNETIKVFLNKRLFNEKLPGRIVFDLYQTYGFPIEMTKELAKEKGIEVDQREFEQEFKKHQELSKSASQGKFKSGLADHSEQTIKYHTAAHLLLASLRKVLGDHVEQKGSNITTERLRFDFSHSEKMTDEQKQEVEKMVNQAIQQNLEVGCQEMSLEEAKKKGAMGIFESKYGEKVKVYTIGPEENPFSKEICAGPHVKRIGELGSFKIIKEESSSAGVRRIKAILE